MPTCAATTRSSRSADRGPAGSLCRGRPRAGTLWPTAPFVRVEDSPSPVYGAALLMRLGVTTLRGSNPRSSAARRPSPGTCRDRACATRQPKVAVRVAVALIPGPTAPRSSARSRPSSGVWPRGCSAQLSSPSYGQAPPGRRGCARPARSAASRRYAGRHQGAAAARRRLPGVSAALCRPVNLIGPARRTPGQARLGSRSWTFDWLNTLTCGFTSQVDEMRPDPEHRRPGPSIANDRHHQLPRT